MSSVKCLICNTVRPRLTLPPDWQWGKPNEMTTESLDFVLMTTQVDMEKAPVLTSAKPPKTRRKKQIKSMGTVIECSFIVVFGLLWI